MTWAWLVGAGLLLAWLAIEARRGRAALLKAIPDLVALAIPGVLGSVAYHLIGFPLDLSVAPPLIAAVVFGRTPLGMLNFLVLQWFGVRLQASFELGDLPRRDGAVVIETGRWWSRSAPRGVAISWSLLRWVWPLTGWWSEYRWIARRGAVR